MTLHTRAVAAFAFATTLAALSGAVAKTAAAQSTDRRTLAGREVLVFNVVGTVTVEAGAVSEVTVEVTRRGMDASRLSVEVGTERGLPALRVVFPDEDIVYPELGRRSNHEYSTGRDGRWGWGSGSWGSRRRIRVKGDGRGVEAWADLRVIIPAGRRVDVNLAVGRVDAANVDGDLGIDVASARVMVNGHTGTLRLNTGSGSAEVRDIKGDGLSIELGSGRTTVLGASVRRMRVESGSGGVELDNVNAAELTVDVGSGGVRADRVTSDRVRIETGSGGVDLRMANSPKSLDVESGSGTVTLTLPSTLDAEVDIQTGSGGIDSDFPVQVNRVERRHLRGRVGTGNGLIRVDTGSGGVRLRKGI